MQQTILGSMSGQWYTVTDPQAARFLVEPETRRYLAPFIGFERTATEAAQEIGVSVERLLYRIRQLLGLGLLLQSGVRKRSGRAQKLYRARAEGFVVPFELTPHADLETLIAQQRAPTEAILNRASARLLAERGLNARLIYRADGGELNNEAALPIELSWSEMSRYGNTDFSGVHVLDDATAREIAEGFDALMQKLMNTRTPEGQGRPYIISVGIAPLSSGDMEEGKG